MKRIVSCIAVLALFALIVSCTPYHSQGTGVGAGVGGVAGALLDHKNPWRGGVIGAALGAIFGATIADVAVKASQESAVAGRPVEYRTTDGRGVYRADPIDYNARTNCHKVQERVWEDGRLIRDQIKEVCEGEKTEQRY